MKVTFLTNAFFLYYVIFVAANCLGGETQFVFYLGDVMAYRLPLRYYGRKSRAGMCTVYDK